MNFTGEIIPFTKTELELGEVKTKKYTTYARFLDKQLCQYLSWNKGTALVEAEEKKLIEDMLSINIFSIAEQAVKIEDVKIIASNSISTDSSTLGCIPLQTFSKNDTSIISVHKNKQFDSDLRIQYSVGDLFVLNSDTEIRTPNIQDFIIFKLTNCLKDEWINSLRCPVKPTR